MPEESSQIGPKRLGDPEPFGYITRSITSPRNLPFRPTTIRIRYSVLMTPKRDSPIVPNCPSSSVRYSPCLPSPTISFLSHSQPTPAVGCDEVTGTNYLLLFRTIALPFRRFSWNVGRGTCAEGAPRINIASSSSFGARKRWRICIKPSWSFETTRCGNQRHRRGYSFWKESCTETKPTANRSKCGSASCCDRNRL